MVNSPNGSVAALIALINRRMTAINSGDREGVLAVYDPYSVFVLDYRKGTALMGKDEIGARVGELSGQATEIICDYSLIDAGTYVRMDWVVRSRKDQAELFGGVDLFWGDGEKIVR